MRPPTPGNRKVPQQQQQNRRQRRHPLQKTTKKHLTTKKNPSKFAVKFSKYRGIGPQSRFLDLPLTDRAALLDSVFQGPSEALIQHVKRFLTTKADTPSINTIAQNASNSSKPTRLFSTQLPEYDETAQHRKKPKLAKVLADTDQIMKVFGNPNNEDPTEPIIRSILPNGIARATGIENPRLGSYVTIHLNSSGGDFGNNDIVFSGEIDSRKRIEQMKKNQDVAASMQPTIQPSGNKIYAEIIRITKHEVFLALPCSPHLINVEDRVSKTKDRVPGFKVPVTVKKGSLFQNSIPDEDDRNDLNINPSDPSLGDDITPLLGSVLNAFGDQIEQVKKPFVIGDDDVEESVNYDFKKKHTIYMPYSNHVARKVLKNKLKALPYILQSDYRKANGILEGSLMERGNEINTQPFQQLHQSDDGTTATYSNLIDQSEIDSDLESEEFDGIDSEDVDSDYEKEVKNDPFLSLPLKKAKLATLLNKNKQFIENIQLPARYRANNTAQLVTGISAIDLFNPIRKGSRMLFTSNDQNELSQFGQVLFKNTLKQANPTPSTIPQTPNPLINRDNNVASGNKEDNANITPIIQSEMFGLVDKKTQSNVPLLPTSLAQQNTIGIYCAIGKTNHAKDTLVKSLNDVLSQSMIIFTNDNDTPYTHTQAVKQAISLSNALRLQGKDVVVVIDDLSHHSGAVMKLTEPFNMAMGSGVTGNHHAVNTTHAQLFDSIGVLSAPVAQHHLKRAQQHLVGADGAPATQEDVDIMNNSLNNTDREALGSSTLINLYTTFPENAQPSLQLRQSEQVLDGLKSIVDKTTAFHPHLQGAKFWPPIELQPLHPVLPSISPVMRPLLQHLNGRIIESQHLYEYAQVSEGLGITLDFDVNETIEWKAKVQALLMQSPNRQFSLVEQYLTSFSAAQDRLLAGIDVVDIPTYRRFLMKSFNKYPTIVNLLANIVNVSTELPLRGYKRRFINPAELYNGDGQLMDKNGQVLSKEKQLDDNATKELLKQKALSYQPYLDQHGTKLSPIDEFICGYLFDQLDSKAIYDISIPLFNKVEASPGSGDYQLPQDQQQIELLVKKLQQKYQFINGESSSLQTPDQALIMKSMLKMNTMGKFGLPIILDELLQIIVDDVHEAFLNGEWKLDPVVEAMAKIGHAKLPPSTHQGGGGVGGANGQHGTYNGPTDAFNNPIGVTHYFNNDQQNTADGIINDDFVANTSKTISVYDDDGKEKDTIFDSTQQSVDLDTKPVSKPKDHPLNVGIAKAMGLESHPELALERAPNNKSWFW